MSQTHTTTQSVTYEPTSVRQILQTYDIHQTTGEPTSTGTSGWSVDSEWRSLPPRSDWTSDYNRIPPYREPSRNHRYFGRPAGRDWGEASFIVMMFSGVYVVSAASKLWRLTLGRYQRWPWGFAIGGEW